MARTWSVTQYQNTVRLMLNQLINMVLVQKQKNRLVKQENTEIGLGINESTRQFQLNEEKIMWLKDYIAEFQLNRKGWCW